MGDVTSPLPKTFVAPGRGGTVGTGVREAQWRSNADAVVLAFVDVLVIEVAIVLAAVVASRLSGTGWTLQVWEPGLAVAGAVMLLVTNLQLRLYDTVGQDPVERFRLRVVGVSLIFGPMLTLAMIEGNTAFPTVILALVWVVVLPLGLLAETVAREALIIGGVWGSDAVLLGSRGATARLAEHLASHPEFGLRPIGRIGDEWHPGLGETKAAGTIPLLGSMSDISRFAGEAAVAVVAQSPDEPPLEPDQLPFRRVIVVPHLIGMPALWSRCGLGEASGFAFSNRTAAMAGHRIKRLFDLLIAVPMLIVATPVICVLAVLIKIVSPGPAFYSQQRSGLGGTPVSILKLRSMHVDAEERLQDLLARDVATRAEWDRYMKLSRDPRTLPMVGELLRRSSLDELPQLWNVVRGDISLVGPRPFPAYHINRFDPAFQTLRARVKPGLTGLWQVTERSNADLRQQEAIDTFYIRNWSLWLDLYIVMRTLPALLSTRGAR